MDDITEPAGFDSDLHRYCRVTRLPILSDTALTVFLSDTALQVRTELSLNLLCNVPYLSVGTHEGVF